MKRVSALILFSLVIISGCGGGSGNGGSGLHIARCNNGQLSEKNSCTEACQNQGGVKEWFTDNCGTVP